MRALRIHILFAVVSAVLVPPATASAGGDAPTDPGWPRVFEKGGKQLTVYQPQVDYWHDYANIHLRCAIGVKGVLKEERFGVAEIDASTATDHAARTVLLVSTQRDIRFPNTSASELAALQREKAELQTRLEQAELIIETQKNISQLLGLNMKKGPRSGSHS